MGNIWDWSVVQTNAYGSSRVITTLSFLVIRLSPDTTASPCSWNKAIAWYFSYKVTLMKYLGFTQLPFFLAAVIDLKKACTYSLAVFWGTWYLHKHLVPKNQTEYHEIMCDSSPHTSTTSHRLSNLFLIGPSLSGREIPAGTSLLHNLGTSIPQLLSVIILTIIVAIPVIKDKLNFIFQ